MELRALGEMEIVAGDGRAVPLGPPKQRLLLAVLICRSGLVVPVDELVDALWPDGPPASAGANLRLYVHGLRRILGTDAVRGSGRPGYQLSVDPESVDIARFARLAALGEAALAAGEPVTARDHLHEALGLWRGHPFADLGDVAVLHAEATRLRERHIAVIEHRVQADLANGRAGELVAELTTLVAEHPYRERLRGQLMCALYRSGRRAEALECYRAVWQVLADHLGIEPGRELRDLHAAMLTGAPELDLPTVTAAYRGAAPAQLPADAGEFTGRDGNLLDLNRLATPDDAAQWPVRPPVAIVGPAGVGKTALVVHWGHRNLKLFPDGQLFLDLRGFHTEAPLTAPDGVNRFLRALGVPLDAIPTAFEEAAALYRSLLSDKQILVVLDNAATVDQIHPLLPGGRGCVVLVTSRRRLPGLVARDAARQLPIGPLPGPAAVELIARIITRTRVERELQAAEQLAAACDHLPLALRIAAANLAERPALRIADFVRHLRDAGRLDALSMEDDPSLAVRAAFDLSYAALTTDQQRLFRLAGLVPGPDLTPRAAAALADCPIREAAIGLDRLAGAHLVQPSAGSRFALHDLIRDYARERAAAEEPDGGSAALERLFGFYVAGADAAARRLYPEMLRMPEPMPLDQALTGPASEGSLAELDNDADALAWLQAESANLVAACCYAADHGPYPTAWLLAGVLRGFCWRSRRPVDWAITAAAGARAAERAGDPVARAAAELNLGHWHRYNGRLAESAAHDSAALAYSRHARWRQAEAFALAKVALTHWRLGDFTEAAAHLRESMAVCEALGQRAGLASAQSNLGLTVAYLGRLAEARNLLSDCLAWLAEHDQPGLYAQTTVNLAEVYLLRGAPEQARPLVAEARTASQRIGATDVEVEALAHASALCRQVGDLPGALDQAAQALHLAGPCADALVATTAHQAVAAAHADLGDHITALTHLNTAHRLVAEVNSRYHETHTGIRLAAVRHQLGDPDAAGALSAPLAAARHHGYRLLEGEALAVQAQICADRAEFAAAATHARMALDIEQETGWRDRHAALSALADAAHT